MKKILLFAAVALSFAACTKENEVINDGVIDASKVVFNIDVRNADAQETKGVKTAWENGDVVYVFFEDNTTQYVKMTYNGSSWTYKDKDGGTTFSDLNLTASGKKLSAVYMPEFVYTQSPTYDTDNWTFGSVEGYFQTAQSVSYSVTSTSNVATLSATISLAAPANIIQIFIPSSEAAVPDKGIEYVLTATHIIPFTFSGIVPGGAASQGNSDIGFPMKGYSGTIGSETGYYFWGLLEGTGTYEYDFQLVKKSVSNRYAISSKSKHVAPGSSISSAAIKLTGLTDNGHFVSMGYSGSPLWATGNLGRSNSDAISSSNAKIVLPLEAGDYFMWGATLVYRDNNNDFYHGSQGFDNGQLPVDYDIANKLNSNWRMPTNAQFEALISNSNAQPNSPNVYTRYITECWKTDWTEIGVTKGGALVTSTANGISLFFAAAGDYFYSDATLKNEGAVGYYWSATPDSSSDHARFLCVDEYSFMTMYFYRSSGYSIRPVKNI